MLYDKATNKQFITVQTKNGNTFFIVIDYDAPINEDEEQYQTYFLNMVDESDLLALLDEDTASALTTCNCKEKMRCRSGQHRLPGLQDQHERMHRHCPPLRLSRIRMQKPMLPPLSPKRNPTLA